MAVRRRYTAAERARAVGIATVDGQTKAAEVTGIPATTIDYWLDKPEFVALRSTAREKVIEQLWVGLQVGVEALTEGIKGSAPLNHKAAAFAALAERYALLNGEATTRSENRELHDRPDHELLDGLREVDRILAAGRDAATAEEPPTG